MINGLAGLSSISRRDAAGIKAPAKRAQMQLTDLAAYVELAPEFVSEQPEAPRVEVPLPRFGHQCCYPIGEPRTPGFGYCIAPVARKGMAYCLEHKLLCHVSPLPSR